MKRHLMSAAAVVAVLVLVLLLGGNAAQAQLSATPNSLVFGVEPVSTPSPAQTVIVSNSDTAEGSISPTFTIDGTNQGDFAVGENNCQSVLPGQSCPLPVIFTPTALGLRTARLVINASGSDPAYVNLSAGSVQDQCQSALPVGTAAGCGALITVTGVDGNGNATFFTVTNLGNGNPYDGTEDSLVGIVNNSTQPLNSITLTSPDTTFGGLFGFDHDGPCGFGPVGGTHDCFNAVPGQDPGDYQGPNTTLTPGSSTTCSFSSSGCFTSGTVTFNTAIPKGGSTYFALEGTPDSLTNVTQTQHTTPGKITVFDFGPFKFQSAVPITSTVPQENDLSVTAVSIPAGTEIDFLDGTKGTCAVYDKTGGNCRAFDLKCTKSGSGAACTNLAAYFAEFATSWDSPGGATVNRPGFGASTSACTLDANGHLSGFTNVLDFFSQTRIDPTGKAPSGGRPPGGDCYIIATDVSYQNAKLSITKVAPPIVKAGTTLPYVIAVLNLGPATATATAVTVTDIVPVGTTYQSSAVCFTGSKGITCQSGAKSPCALTDTVVTCTLGNLLPFSVKTLASIGILLNFTATASSGSTISNTAIVNDANNIPSPGINSNVANTKVCRDIVRGKCVQ